MTTYHKPFDFAGYTHDEKVAAYQAALAVLEDARTILSGPEKWTKVHEIADANDRPVDIQINELDPQVYLTKGTRFSVRCALRVASMRYRANLPVPTETHIDTLRRAQGCYRPHDARHWPEATAALLLSQAVGLKPSGSPAPLSLNAWFQQPGVDFEDVEGAFEVAIGLAKSHAAHEVKDLTAKLQDGLDAAPFFNASSQPARFNAGALSEETMARLDNISRIMGEIEKDRIELPKRCARALMEARFMLVCAEGGRPLPAPRVEETFGIFEALRKVIAERDAALRLAEPHVLQFTDADLSKGLAGSSISEHISATAHALAEQTDRELLALGTKPTDMRWTKDSLEPTPLTDRTAAVMQAVLWLLLLAFFAFGGYYLWLLR